MEMVWPDYIIIGLLLVSVVVGMLRGFIMEVFSLLIWAAAFLVAYNYSSEVASWLEGSVSLPSARMAIGFAGLFFATLLIGGLLNYLVGQLVQKTGLSGTDRLIGAAFGIIRGLAVVVALLILASFTPLTRDPWWSESPLIQRLLPLSEWATGLMPETLQELIYDEPDTAEAGDAA